MITATSDTDSIMQKKCYWTGGLLPLPFLADPSTMFTQAQKNTLATRNSAHPFRKAMKGLSEALRIIQSFLRRYYIYLTIVCQLNNSLTWLNY